MKKIILIGILISIILISGAGCEVSDKLAKEIASENIDKLVVCESPYIRHGTECCLDQNNNKICDEDEGTKTVQPPTPTTPTSTQQPTTTPTQVSDEKFTSISNCINTAIEVVDVSYTSDSKIKVNVDNIGDTNLIGLNIRIIGNKISEFIEIKDNIAPYGRISKTTIETFSSSDYGNIDNWKVEVYPKIKEGICKEGKKVVSIKSTISDVNEKYTLRDYPNIFIKNKNFDGKIVVGQNCPASDTIGQSVLLADLQGYVNDAIPSSAVVIDNEIGGLESSENYILLSTGNCNSLITNPSLSQNEATISINYISDKNFILSISGNSGVDTRNAVEAIVSGKLSGINSQSVIVKSPSQRIGIYTVE